MKYAVIVMLDTELAPTNIIEEVVSQLEGEPSTNTVVHSVVVLVDDGEEVAVYDRKEKNT